MNAIEALVVGFNVPWVGVPLRGFDILVKLGLTRDVNDPAGAYVRGMAERLRAANSDTVDRVMRVEAIHVKNGLPAPPRPRTFEDYVRWSEAATRATAASLVPDSPAAIAMTL